jgi:ribonuclease P protein component
MLCKHALTFPKTARLLAAHQFRRVNKYGKTIGGKFFTIQICISKNSCLKLGLTVPRKYGNAIHRNRFKRLVREAFRLSQRHLPSHIHINIRPTLPPVPVTFEEIQRDLISLLNNHPSHIIPFPANHEETSS